jgi:hypothetical protein
MAHDADSKANAGSGTRTDGKPSGRHWLWLLVLPWIAMIWVPSYNKVEPQLFEFPFFYWYQLLWVLISAVITAFVYFKTRPKSRSQRGAS